MTLLASKARQHLLAGQQSLAADWKIRRKGNALLKARSALVDEVLQSIWAEIELPAHCALVAVGGYGRGALYPHSDVDLLILLARAATPAEESQLEQLVGLLWDIGLDIGHSVRTIAECVDEASRDITIQTSLLESRFLAGDQALFDDYICQTRNAVDTAAFCNAKLLEQAERYAKFHDTPYALEPNCKESPGGLRDLQVILWVARAACLGDDWQSLSQQGLITLAEARQLERAERRLRDLRIELHFLTGRREERLLFEHQEKLAMAMSIEATNSRRASEVLMQHYYKNAKQITQLNLLVMQLLTDHLAPLNQGEPDVIDAQFQLIHDLLDVREDDVFEKRPSAILDCYLLQMQRSDISGLTPRTLRALWRARSRVNAAFRERPENRTLFIQLFQQAHLIHSLRRMNQFDILGRYLPAFGRIVGQMQHDLFHVYTVDQHILQVMRNLRRFTMPELAHEYPFCTQLIAGFERHWLLYIAALFHDIAKGRGGDHSKLGMEDAKEFCANHRIDEEDSALVIFLVEHHLLMSQVAQKQDLSDEDVIQRFAEKMGSMRRLTALYLVTVADIRGTSPKVWNAWKGKLLEDLFRLTAKRLQGDQAPALAGINERQNEARSLLALHGLRSGVEDAFWSQLDTGYFIRHDADEVAWHTRTLYYRTTLTEPVVTARANRLGEGLQVMVYLPDQPHLFARLCGYFALEGYTIVDAKIHTTRHAYALDSFVIFSSDPTPAYRDLIPLIETGLVHQLTQLPPLPTTFGGRLSRQVRHFPITPHIDIRADERGSMYLMTVSAADRPGLLFAIARILGEHGVTLHTAKIATLGERVEDMFLISGKELAYTASLVRLEQEVLAALTI